MNNRPSRAGGGQCPWLAILLSLAGAVAAAVAIWYGVGPGDLPYPATSSAVALNAQSSPPIQSTPLTEEIEQAKAPNPEHATLEVAANPAGLGKDGGLEWLSDEQILSNLETVVFGSEFVGEDSSHVRKWVGPMRVAVYGDVDGQFSDLVISHLAHLQSLTGIDITQVAENDPSSNAHILFLGRSQFDSYAHTYLARGKPGTNRNIACFGVFKSNRREILEFHAMIPRSAPREEVRACIIEELTQVLGLPNDSFDIRPSIFNDDDEFHDLTWQDELFLRVIYDDRIRPGMARAEFQPVARAIIAELRAEGLERMLAAKPPPEGEAQPAATPVGYSPIETPRLTRDLDQ